MWPRIIMLMLLGYVCMGRSFAYWGIPPLHLFIGEIVLAWFLFSGPAADQGRWPWVALKSPTLLRFKKLFVLFFAFGVFQVFRGIALGHPPLNAVRDLAFNYYPLYFLLGLWVGCQDEEFLQKALPKLAWACGIYGIFFILLLSWLPWYFPGTAGDASQVPIFGQPEYSSAILMGLLAVQKDWRRNRAPLLLNGAVLIGMLIRSQWLAYSLALSAFAFMTRDKKRIALGAAAVLVPLALMFVTDFQIPGPESRGGTISTRDMVGRMIAPFDEEAAAQLTEDAARNEDTAAFRTIWWLEIWYSVNETPERALFGHGYGYALGELVPYLDDLPVRTPHNAFFFALGYTGWIGVFIFAAVQLELLRLLWKVYKSTGESFGIVFWVAETFYSLFTAFFEAPYGAIPFYLLVGCACAPLLLAEKHVLAAAPGPLDTLGGSPLSVRLPGASG